jgi:hypothetical protein
MLLSLQITFSMSEQWSAVLDVVGLLLLSQSSIDSSALKFWTPIYNIFNTNLHKISAANTFLAFKN